MRKYLSVILAILFLWSSSCNNEETPVTEPSDKKIVITDLDHEPVVKDLLSKIQGHATNGRISAIEVTDAFFKYDDPDSGILNYTFRLPDDSPDYFENLILSQYDDGFYGFVYRYIPDEGYTNDAEFKGILQQYNLRGELINELAIPFQPENTLEGGRTQLVNQCVKSIEQTCVSTYEVQTVTDYPCHCQYDRKTLVSNVCTFSFNIGWCDDGISVPPAGGGGTYVGASDGTSPRGGAGGGTKPKPVKKPVVLLPDDGYDDITYDQVKSPCLVNVIKNLLREDFKNKINQKAKYWFVDAEEVQNLDFKEVNVILDTDNQPVHAQTGPPYLDKDHNTHIEIHLNSSTLPGTSELYQIIAIYHETKHGIFNIREAYQNKPQKEKHELMSSPEETQSMVDAVSEIYGRKLSMEEIQQVAALWLYNFKDALRSNNFQQSMTKWNLNEDKIIQIGEKEERVVKVIVNGVQKIKSIGGSNCSND